MHVKMHGRWTLIINPLIVLELGQLMWNEKLVFQLSEKSHNRKRNYFKDNTENNNENISKGKLKEMKK